VKLYTERLGMWKKRISFSLQKMLKIRAKDTSLKQQFEKGEKDPEFLKNLAGLTIYNDPEFAGKVLNRYFQQKTALDQEDVQMLLSGVQSTESPVI
jgi:hypothetical protein